MKKPGVALLIVDVQKGFVREPTMHIPSMVSELQYDYDVVAATQFYNQEGSFYRTLIHWDRLQADTEDFQLAFSLCEGAKRIIKPSYTCVTPHFVDFLQKNNIDRVDVCGLETDICVTKCAVDLFEAGIEPVVLKDYCASTSGRDAHDRALVTLSRFIGQKQIR